MTTVQTVYDDVADFIAAMNPAKLLELRATDAARERLTALIEKEKESGLSIAEKDELDHYLVLERLIRLSKAHARQRLAAL
jgi:DNA replicative helicase MCM subunit Mcm2 (Cdc46/Mcm family)